MPKAQKCLCSKKRPKSTRVKSTCVHCANQIKNRCSGRGKKVQITCARCRARIKPCPVNVPDKLNRPCKYFKCCCTKSTKRSNKSKNNDKICKCALKKTPAKRTSQRSNKSKNNNKCCKCAKKTSRSSKKGHSDGSPIKARRPVKKCKCRNAPPNKKSRNRRCSNKPNCTCYRNANLRNKKKRRESKPKQKMQKPTCKCKQSNRNQKRGSGTIKKQPQRTSVAKKQPKCPQDAESQCKCIHDKRNQEKGNGAIKKQPQRTGVAKKQTSRTQVAKNQPRRTDDAKSEKISRGC